MGVRNIQIRISQIGGRTVAQDIANIGTAAARAGGQIGLANKILQGFAAAAAARRIATFADSYSQLESRARIYTKSQEEANKVSSEIVAIANRTRLSIDAVSLTYQRLAITQQRLGLSTERVTRLVELLSKAVTIGGSNAQEAGGALRQFSQALSGNFKAAAQELNSVLEQTPGLAAALAAGLGVATDQIKALAKQGKLSSELVVKAIESQADAIEQRFGRVGPTISGAFQLIENGLTVFIGRASQVSGLTRTIFEGAQKMADGLIALAGDTQKLSAVLETFGTILGLLAIEAFTQKLLQASRAMLAFTAQTVFATGSGLAGFVSGIASATAGAVRLAAATGAALTTPITRATFSLASMAVAANAVGTALTRTAVAVTRFAIAATGIALNVAIAGLGVFAGLLFTVRNELVKTSDGGFVRFQDVALGALSVVTDRLREFIDTLSGAFGPGSSNQSNVRRFFNFFISGFDAIVQVAKITYDQLGQLFEKYVKSVGLGVRGLFRLAQGDLDGGMDSIRDGLLASAKTVDPIGDKIFGALLKTQNRDYLQEVTDGILSADPEIEKRAKARRAAFLKQEEEDAKRRNELFNNLNSPAAGGLDLLATLTREQEGVAKLVATYDIATKTALEFRDAQDTLKAALDQGVLKSYDEVNRIISELATDQFRRLAAETDTVAAATIDYNDAVDQLRALMNAGRIDTDEFASAQSRLLDQLLKVRENFEDTSWMDRFFRGLNDGFRRFGDSLGTTFTQISDLTNTLSEQGLSAIDKFVTTGEFDFREFAATAIGEIQKVITRLILINVREDYAAGGVAGVFKGLFSDGDRSGNGVTRASTQTGAGGETKGLIEQIFGGQRPDNSQQTGPTGSFADPLAVQIVGGAYDPAKIGALTAGGPVYGPPAPSTTDGIPAPTGGGFFDGIKNFFSGFFEKITGIFTSISGLFGQGGIGGALSGIFGGGGGGGGKTNWLGLASKALGAFGGGGFGGFMEGGGLIGPQQLGQAFVVGEKRPELFVPRQTGTMMPNAAAALGGSQPNVNVKVVNVDDPAGTLGIMQTTEGEEVIWGMIQRRRGELRELVG